MHKVKNPAIARYKCVCLLEIDLIMLLYSAEWMSADNDMEASRGDLVLGNIMATYVCI
jgi:hypothetical protein